MNIVLGQYQSRRKTRDTRVAMQIGMALLLLMAIGVCASPGRQLTFEDRVRAQEAIERVYYSHRIWPKENPGPKPPFEEMMPWAQIEAKVEDYLKKSAALDMFWQRPITAEQLQAEMNRMAKQTKEPATLRELFAALDNDPYLIAECLARTVLANRLIHNWYSYDSQFHAEALRKANKALQDISPDNFKRYPEGAYRRVKYVICHRPTLAVAGEKLKMRGERVPRRPRRN